jgi:hypothetical protein
MTTTTEVLQRICSYHTYRSWGATVVCGIPVGRMEDLAG